MSPAPTRFPGTESGPNAVRAARMLASGGGWERAALRLEWEREEGEQETDWWEVARPRRRDASPAR